jgi:O-antigen/teichoic acid export membrane protein
MMNNKNTAEPGVIPAIKVNRFSLILHRFVLWISTRGTTQRSIGMIASANLTATIIGVIGSFVQARFITPEELGFIRKYSVISGYAIFFSLGLFIILHREYAVLVGRGEKEKADHTVAIVQSWILIVATLICSGLLVLTIVELVQMHWREASAWFIQVVAVWTVLYVGFLDCTFRSGQEFERRSKGQFLSTMGSAAVIPLFWLWSFPALVLRSVVGPIIQSTYFHIVRPVKVGWSLPWREFLNLVKRGMRLFVSDYLRYNFWLTVEIWLMLSFSGDKGVGLYVFGSMLIDISSQIITSINMVYIPQLAQKYGQTGKITSCLKLAAKPTLINFGISLLIIFFYWFLLPPLISFAFPNYLDAIPIIRILILRIILIGFTLPMFMLTILESYITQFVAVVFGLLVFVGTAFMMNSRGFNETAMPWGSLAGQVIFTMICLIWLGYRTSKKSIAIH